jgi:hypothetical protein
MRRKNCYWMVSLVLFFALVSLAFASFDEPIVVKSEKVPQAKIYDTKFSKLVRGICYNVRDGVLGILNNGYQAVMGVGSGASLLTGKVLIFTGDVIGQFDDNIFTRYIFRGWLSDKFEELAFVAFTKSSDIMLISDKMSGLPIVTEPEEFTRDDVIWHTRLYLQPHVIFTVPVVLISDCIVRPIGNIAKIFSFRRFTDLEVNDVPTQIDEWGRNLIRRAYNWRFFYVIPEEEEPNIRLMSEEETFKQQ